ncbi:MAG: hypothetical protein AAB215_03105 [Planctomycetota bacterium]
MLLVAQRVVSKDGLQGINAYRYSHGPSPWPADPVPLLDAKTASLERQAIQVQPGGNQVVSFMDAAVPDGTTEEEWLRLVRQLAEKPAPGAFPLTTVLGPCAFRLDMQPGLFPVWRSEFKELVRHLVLL